MNLLKEYLSFDPDFIVKLAAYDDRYVEQLFAGLRNLLTNEQLAKIIAHHHCNNMYAKNNAEYVEHVNKWLLHAQTNLDQLLKDHRAARILEEISFFREYKKSIPYYSVQPIYTPSMTQGTVRQDSSRMRAPDNKIYAMYYKMFNLPEGASTEEIKLLLKQKLIEGNPAVKDWAAMIDVAMRLLVNENEPYDDQVLDGGNTLRFG